MEKECGSIQENRITDENDVLKELKLSGNINVWSTNQEVLEEQALTELEKFREEQEQDVLEEGEIIENVNEQHNKAGNTVLDIESYIKRQQELKKRQEYKRSLGISDHSKELANKISSKNYKKQVKRKRITSESNNNERIVKNDNHTQTSSENSREKEGVTTEENLDGNAHAIVDYFDDNSKSGSEYMPSEDEADSDYEQGNESSTNNTSTGISSQSLKRKRKYKKAKDTERVKDDGLLKCYKSRLNLYYKRLEEELALKEINNDEEEEDDHHLLKGGLKIPIKIWNNLYRYQQDGVKWLWKIQQKPTGGLLGDEMGLGKTVQIIAFLHSLEYSRISSCHGRFTGLGPSIIVCPATVIHQWVEHFHEWAPEFRVAVLHQSGNYQGNKADLIKEMSKCKGIIITTYLGILKYKGNLLEYTWHYIVLDEGHKIRNPTAKVSIAVKHLRTPHRIMLTGSPMQNNLTELWSLFDFTNPGMLGNLTTFQEHFANPILHGGFSNSTPMQEATALSVATTLKNIITPYLLRRSKNEVQHHILLPNKSEQVLFCSLTNEQRDLYKGYLMSEHVNMILGRGTKNWYSGNYMKSNVLMAITTLRKICNHPDIYLCEADENNIKNDESTPIDERYGYYKRSGKMVVVSALLKIWKKQGHRVLLFTQGRFMITVFQDFLEQQGYKYVKMDGSTSISSRQPIINKFNEDTSYDVFLLTTRVGGLGVNLTGANRVIIFDPDWNPATDTQARERAWRIGQEKQVTIYRLLSAGTIEEKMYQRQVWKQLLSNKVLLDPKTNRFFKTSDLHDLFSLQESVEDNPETANIFYDSRVRIQEKLKEKEERKKKHKKTKADKVDSLDVQFTEDKIQAMKTFAQQIAKSLSQNKEEPAINKSKTSYQLELEEERQRKLQEKAELKKLTPQGLLLYNKEKAKQKVDNTINRIDDCETNVSFSKALEYTEKTAKLHHALISGKKDPEVVIKKVVDIRKNVTKEKSNAIIVPPNHINSSDTEGNSAVDRTRKSKHKSSHKNSGHKKHNKRKHRDKSVVDTSGTIDGEEVEGLVKTELRKTKKDKHKLHHDAESQDDFVLGKLFAKKGVSSALKHDSIIQSGSQGNSLRVHTEARMRAERSLEALRKSRLDNWRW